MLKRIKHVMPAAAALIALFLLSGCSKMELDSHWTAQNLKMSGEDSLWSSSAAFIKDANALVSVKNDDKYLYVFLSSSDRNLERALFGRGMTVWFDPGGGNDKVIGVDFPLGMSGMRRNMQRPEEGDEQSDNREGFREEFEKGMREFEIVEPDKNVRIRTSSAETKEIEVRLERDHGNLVYKLKMPLRATKEFRFGIGADTGAVVGIGVELNEFKRPDRESGMDFREEGGMRGGEGGMEGGERMGERGRRGGMRGDRGERGPSSSADLNFWVKTKLASGLTD